MHEELKRIGLSVVYQPPENQNHELDIVLVHGLSGHPENKWSYNSHEIPHDNELRTNDHEPPTKKRLTSRRLKGCSIFWPRGLLPHVFPNARISTWGYDVQIESMFASTSKASVFHHAQTLLIDLAALRSPAFDKSNPVIFIAHSLGGIVVKDKLCMSRTETTFLNEILPATLGVMFLGTPHHGSKIASIAETMFDITELFLQKPNKKILRALKENSEILERINRDFGLLLNSGKLRVHSFREELDVKGIRIVDDFSSSIGYLDETKGSLYADHRNMAKYAFGEDEKFQRVVSILRRWLDQTSFELSRPRDENDDIPDDLIFDEEYQNCLMALNNVEAKKRLQNIEPAYETTYEWIFSPEIGFRKWLEGKHPSHSFWIYGKPGSGKSTAMKYAMTHPLLRESLNLYHERPWIIAGYFFHDRGSESEKSIEGFLKELVYQILKRFPQLFRIVYASQLGIKAVASLPSQITYAWDIRDLEVALSKIASETATDINLCLFVDALDEHDGNHTDLIAILRHISELPNNEFFRLRLCLAGRPENAFRDAFEACPSFAIHDYTIDDIRRYVEGRLLTGVKDRFINEGRHQVLTLVSYIIERAHGVFLWVRLVVDEVSEGLREGDSIQELKELLSSIPTELESMYARAICRKTRGSKTVLERDRHEAYVMFQIALCCFQPLPLIDFLTAALWLTRGASGSDLRLLSIKQLSGRLNSRSTGLLEAPGGDYDSKVQFIHQTVKEFLSKADGSALIAANAGDKALESGYLLMVRYTLITALEYTLEDGRVDKFSFYAQNEEYGNGTAVKDALEHTLLQFSPSQQRRILVQLISGNIHRMDMDILFNIQDQRFFFFYALCNLPLSLRETHFLGPVNLSSKTRFKLLHRSLPLKIGSEALERLGDYNELKNMAESSQPAESPLIIRSVFAHSKDLEDDFNINTSSELSKERDFYSAAQDIDDTKNIKGFDKNRFLLLEVLLEKGIASGLSREDFCEFDHELQLRFYRRTESIGQKQKIVELWDQIREREHSSDLPLR